MASSINTCLLLLLAIATSYFSNALANITIMSITLTNGKVYCTTDGNPNLSCGGRSCPPAVNATVTLAVPNTNIVIAQTTTNATGLFSFSLTYNATSPSPITLLNIPSVVAYVSLPVASCPALSGAGILKGLLLGLPNFTTGGVAVTFTPITYIRL